LIPKEWGDTTKLKPFSLPVIDDITKQGTAESFIFVQKPIEFEWNAVVESLIFDEKIDER
jgi:hypothetical protein